MNYNRLLDIDIISSNVPSDQDELTTLLAKGDLRRLNGKWYTGFFGFGDHITNAHFAKQEQKLTHISPDTVANLDQDILRPRSSVLYPDQPNGELSNELRSLTYIYAYADLHAIQQNPNKIYPCLNKLMRWACDATKTAKIIIRVHGTAYNKNKKLGYVYEGRSKLSIRKIIACFVTNGLIASPDLRLLGIKPGATWLNDNSAQMCMHNGCTRRFKLFTRRHHCRRCGQIFCDRHSSQTRSLHEAFSKTAGKTKLNGERVRVCDTCAAACDAAARNPGANAAPGIGMYKGGLRTFKIFSCQAASHSDPRSMLQRTQQTVFDSNSIAHEAVEEFRDRGVHGVKVTASPYTLTQRKGPSYIEKGDFEVIWPGQNGHQKSEFIPGMTASLPRSIYGYRINDPLYALLSQASGSANPRHAVRVITHNYSPQFIANDQIQPDPQREQRTILFGGATGAGITALKDALRQWQFAGCTVLQRSQHGTTTFAIHFPPSFVERVEFTNDSDLWKIFWARHGRDDYAKFKHIKVTAIT
jgi:hypothetical protein